MEEIYLINSSNIPNNFSRSEIKNGDIALVQHKHLTNWKCNLEDQHWKNCQTNERVSSNLPSKNPISLSKSEITAGNYSSNLGGRMGCQMEERGGRTWVKNGRTSWNLGHDLVEKWRWKNELKPRSRFGGKLKMEKCSVSWKNGVQFTVWRKWGKTKIENENE